MNTRLLLAIALLTITAIPGLGKSGSEEQQRNRLQSLRNGKMSEVHPSLLERAYLDTYSILEGRNRCSSFFGGRSSRYVLDELIISLSNQSIPNPKIGIHMFGTFKTEVEPQEGLYYRVFEKAELNRLGPFYNSKTFPSQPQVPNIGSFKPNTREARALMLLHELAHLIKGSQGKWLIQDDGDSPEQSRTNTFLVESNCRLEIRNL